MAAYAWALLAADGKRLGTSEPFLARDAAEAWLSEQWQSLADDGAEEVVLLEDGREVYRMGLGAP